MSPLVIGAAVTAIGVLTMFAALALAHPRPPLEVSEAPFQPSPRPSRRVSLRERINQPFQVLAERSSQQRRLNGGLTLVEHLARADIKLRSSEFVMIEFGFCLVSAALALLRFGFGVQFVVAGVIAYLLPMRYVKYRERKRLREFDRRLPDTLVLLANAMKAGLSLPQALDVIAHNTTPPISDELGRAVRETNLGAGPEQSLANMVRRVGSQDLDLIVTAITVQTAVGGNLARLLDTISQTIRQRVQVKNQISALTAQARASGWIITFLPLIVAVFLYAVTPSYFQVMIEDTAGRILLVLAVVAILAGNYFIRRIVNFKV